VFGLETLPANLRNLLKEIKRELTQKEKVREEAHESMRKAASFSKQAILLSHQKRLEEAKKQLEKAKEVLTKLKELSKDYPSTIYGGMFSAALQEYSEACIFVKLIEESQFTTPEEIDVPPADYVLGLADVVGEFRRLALDSLREGDVAKGEKCLLTMDEIYVELEALDEAYMLVQGLRRKNDVARRIIEATRGDITQEVRRKALEDYLRRFEEKYQNPPKLRKG
jgi:translin